MTKPLNNVKNEKCTLKDLEYGEKTEDHVLFDAFSRPARKNTTDQNLLRQSFILTSSGKESKKQEREKTKTPSLLRSILLRLGRVTP